MTSWYIEAEKCNNPQRKQNAGFGTLLRKEEETEERGSEYLHEEFAELEEAGKHSTHALAYNVKLGTPGSSPGIPIIQGTFTNWYPHQMQPIENFWEILEEHKSDLLKMLIRD